MRSRCLCEATRTKLWQSNLLLHINSNVAKPYKCLSICRYAREKLKERRIKPTVAEVKMKKEEQETYQPYEEPGWSARPLGQWKTVET